MSPCQVPSGSGRENADDLKDLADTIDGLLERLDGSFAAQRRFVASAAHELRTRWPPSGHPCTSRWPNPSGYALGIRHLNGVHVESWVLKRDARILRPGGERGPERRHLTKEPA